MSNEIDIRIEELMKEFPTQSIDFIADRIMLEFPTNMTVFTQQRIQVVEKVKKYKNRNEN